MKSLAVITKNFRLLFRAKETAFTIFFGPLLIILLVSAAYTGGADNNIRVGTYAPEYTGLADDVITSMKEEGYQVNVFSNASECTDLIRTGEIHTCVVFPEDFRIKENGSNNVVFQVDTSRVNLVYQIIDSLTTEFAEQSGNISEELAGSLLTRVQRARETINGQLENALLIDQQAAALTDQVSSGRQRLSSVDVNVSFVDLKEIRGRTNGLGLMIDDLATEGTLVLSDAKEILRTAEQQCDNCSESFEETIDEGIRDIENATLRLQEIAEDGPQRVQEVGFLIDDAAAAMRQVQSQFGELVNASEEVDDRLVESKALIDNITGRITTLRGQLQYVETLLSSGLSAEGVASPITHSIEQVNTEESNLAFTYPYILLLVIMFLGLMLSSNLIVMDKTSKAAFRNFTTATRDEYQILMSFVTTFIILLMQTMVILLVSYFLVDVPLFENFGVSLIIIFFAITIFSFLGMILGYMSGTLEAAMISSLSVGSVLLFISNLVLPLEAMNTVVQALSIYNPYVVLSELLKQSMLHDLSLVHIPLKIGILVATALGLFLLVLLVQRSFKRRYFQKRGGDIDGIGQKAAKPLLVGETEIRDLFDLLEFLDSMTRNQFELVVNVDTNPFYHWVKDEVGDKKLARKLKTQSKERMILALEKHVRKLSKKANK